MWWIILLLFILLFFSSFFSILEISLLSLDRISIKTLIEESKIKGLKEWLENPDKIHTGILIGNNIVNTIFTVIFVYQSAKFSIIKGWSIGLVEICAGLIAFLLLLIFGEIIPKTVGRYNPERIIKIFFRFLRVVLYLLYPLTIFFTFLGQIISRTRKISFAGPITKSELEEELQERIVFAERKERKYRKRMQIMINKVLNLDNFSVTKIMVPRSQIDWVNIQNGKEYIIDYVIESGWSRVPVYEQDFDNIIGIIYARDLLNKMIKNEEFSIAEILRPPYFVSPQENCSSLLEKFRKNKVQIALVKDKGRIQGLLTLEDILEEIVGEISDEFDFALQRIQSIKI